MLAEFVKAKIHIHFMNIKPNTRLV